MGEMTTSHDHDGASAAESATFEDSLSALEAAVRDLEDGKLTLTEALARYEQSVKLLQRCYQLLEAAEQKIELLAGVADDGTPRTEPFAEAGPPSGESVARPRRQRSRGPAADSDQRAT
jgi:exodeoxyribonuclease VII small subunit